MKIYIVEDAPERIEWFRKTFHDCEMTITDQVEKACNDIEENEYDIIFLDRDLGHYKFNGEDIAWHMKENKLAKNAAIIIHSVNPRGQRNIKKYLEEYHSQVLVIPFPQLRKMNRGDFIEKSEQIGLCCKSNTYVELIGRHKGEDCFVLAAGPTLYDIFYKEYKDYIGMLKDNVVISVNASIMACVEHLDWLTEGDKRYWISDDSLTTRWSWWGLVEQSKCIKIVRDSWLKQNHYGNTDGFLHFAPRPTTEGVINPDDVGLAYCSSAPSAIDLGIQMGCKNIYLLGLDHEKRDGKIYYWEYLQKSRHPKQFKPGKPPWNVQKDMYKMNALAYEALDKYAEQKNCNIYNCSQIAHQKKTTYSFKYKDFSDIINKRQ